MKRALSIGGKGTLWTSQSRCLSARPAHPPRRMPPDASRNCTVMKYLACCKYSPRRLMRLMQHGLRARWVDDRRWTMDDRKAIVHRPSSIVRNIEVINWKYSVLDYRKY